MTFSHHAAGTSVVDCHTHGHRTITVVVQDQKTRKPFRGAKVSLFGPSKSPVATTAANGHAVFRDCRAGKYHAKAVHPGFDFIPEGVIEKPTSDHLTLLAVPRPVHWGVDTNQSGIDLAHVKQQGKSWVGRYLSDDGSGRDPALGPVEAPRYGRHGLDLVLLWEYQKMRALEELDQKTLELISKDPDHQKKNGNTDAHAAVFQMKQCHIPDGQVIYFTVDFDETNASWKGGDGRLVDAYFQGVHQVLPKHRVGCYGTYVTLKNLFDDNKYIDYGWQMIFGGKGDQIDHRVQIYQYDIWPQQFESPDAGQNPWNVAGVGALDLDVAVVDRFGQFRFTG